MSRNISLHHKILFGYLVLMAVIIGMAAILFHEHARLREIESDTYEIRQARRDISEIHRNITVLASLGESAIAWEDEDYRAYHARRLKVDSLLQALQQGNGNMVENTQIDTLRVLLLSKEEHLHRIMQLFQRQEEADSLLVNHLPQAAKEAARTQTVVQKKKGIAGWFGGKETVEVPASSDKLNSLNRQLLTLQTERIRNMENYTDSLRIRNRELNRQLFAILGGINDHAQAAFQHREEQIAQAHRHSTSVITGLIIAAILLLVFSYFIIQRDLKRKAANKKQMEQLIGKLRNTVKKNKELISARQRIMQTVTHELRTPLTVISGNAELIGTDSEEDRHRHLLYIRQSADRMADMLDSLLNYFRIDSGKEQPHPEPFNLRYIAETLEATFAPLAENKRLSLHINNSVNTVAIGDKELILRIGNNLLSNAVKFTEQGSVSLTTVYSDGIFTMKVSDTGCGISKKTQAKIFKPFERLTNAATQDGFGLGLPIVNDLVKLMGGKLSLESTKGYGCRFTISIPLEPAEEYVKDTGKTKLPKLRKNTSVLLLDNDELLLSMTRDMLTREGIHCDTCRNAKELTDRMRSRNYNLLITDLKMPEMNGYEVLELLRNSDIGNSRTIPVAVTTAIDREAEAELLAAGFCSCLFKPFSTSELTETVLSCADCVKQSQDIDLSPLLACENKAEILEKLITETRKEMESVESAYRNKDFEALDDMIHHLRSSWMIMNADTPLHDLYAEIHKEKPDDILLKEKTETVLHTGEQIICMAEKRKEDLWEE